MKTTFWKICGCWTLLPTEQPHLVWILLAIHAHLHGKQAVSSTRQWSQTLVQQSALGTAQYAASTPSMSPTRTSTPATTSRPATKTRNVCHIHGASCGLALALHWIAGLSLKIAKKLYWQMQKTFAHFSDTLASFLSQLLIFYNFYFLRELRWCSLWGQSEHLPNGET